ncbi:hypothetical protein [Ralstonia pseudosolanacearum]|uniref:hypothetical protein n=1 Tax=Ralstonia pseudosolanacearum TaxID=1310165 RepID=UPI001FFA6582|nr:hypothetical protein [Ralstonia pseudosolanacearum]
MEKIEGREIVDFVEVLGELAWAKFETRRPTFSIKDSPSFCEDRSCYPPYAVFRFRDERDEVIERLKLGVSDYKGGVEWVMVGHKRYGLPGTNWMICPRRLLEVEDLARSKNITAGGYMAQFEPDFGPVAYDDVINLVGHLRAIFS